jgi:low affinity Fe/Cu permease
LKEGIKEFMHLKKESIWFEKFASKATKATGSSVAFIIACLLVLTWVVTGILFHSNIWPILINTITSTVTFLMVFLIQKTQNKDAISIQIKLNELVAANENASNRIISVEDLSEKELIRLNKHYTRLAEITKEKQDLKSMHSIEDIAISKEEAERYSKKKSVAH